LKAVIYVAKNNGLVKITDISASADISEGMVRRIVADLEKSGIFSTVK
jgi:DNA-binding IscR family transcriptional regulator